MIRTEACAAIARSDRQETLLQTTKSLLGTAFFALPRAATGPARWWTAPRLVATLILMAWGKSSETLGDRFTQARALWSGDDAGQTYQGFIKAWERPGLHLALAAAARLRQAITVWAGRSKGKIAGWTVLAVDGSRFELPRTAEHLRVFGTAGKGDNNPQLWVTLLWHLGLGLPWAWRIGCADSSERHHLRALLQYAPAGCLLAMDAGFTGYDLLRQIQASGRYFLLRVGRQVELLKNLGDVQIESDGAVYLWPARAQGRQQPPLKLRLIRLPGQGRSMYLLTNILAPGALADAQAGRIYRRRWGIELIYRALKQTLQARKLRSHAPLPALLEIHGLLLGLTLLGLRTRQAIGSGRQGRRWSLAQALRVVRQGLHQPQLRQAWTPLLAQAVPDGYKRKHKTRVLWPRKKQHDPPPGEPRCRPATPAERRHAATLGFE